MRRVQPFVVVAAIVGLAAASVGARGSAPTAVGRPNPLLTNLSLDYAQPLTARGGGPAALLPLGAAAIDASVRDEAFLRYQRDDWGGFATPPLGGLAFTGGGAVLVGTSQKAGIALYETEAGGGIESYTSAAGGMRPTTKPSSTPSSNPKPSPAPLATSTAPQAPLPSPTPVPCASSGFGGTACGAAHVPTSRPAAHHRRKHRRKQKHLRARGKCGKPGISIVSDLPHCRFAVLNGAPGYGTFEHLRIKNTTKRRFRLSFEAKGTPTPLWDFLELGVWRTGKAAPTPLPPLGFWTHGFTRLVTVKPGKTIGYTIELYLPASAGNAAQHQSASIAFVWRAVAP